MRWHRSGQWNLLEQLVGKQYSYGKGPEYTSEPEKVQAENRFQDGSPDIDDILNTVGQYKDIKIRPTIGFEFLFVKVFYSATIDTPSFQYWFPLFIW